MFTLQPSWNLLPGHPESNAHFVTMFISQPLSYHIGHIQITIWFYSCNVLLHCLPYNLRGLCCTARYNPKRPFHLSRWLGPLPEVQQSLHHGGQLEVMKHFVTLLTLQSFSPHKCHSQTGKGFLSTNPGCYFELIHIAQHLYL